MKFLRLASLTSVVLLSSAANAQLTPGREYYGVNRAIPMTISTPINAGGEIEIALYDPDSGDAIQRVAAARGGVDLAGLFPILWSSTTPATLNAQLIVGGTKIGSPVVLIPMLTPRSAEITYSPDVKFKSTRPGLRPSAPNGARPKGVLFTPESGRAFSGIRAYTDRHIVFETSAGEVELALRPDKAPNTCRHILDLVEGGYYTDIKVHRILAPPNSANPFVIQFGDPTGMGNGGPGMMIDLEPSDLPHQFGIVSMARTSDPDTNGSQVFLCLSRAGTQFLDGKYTSFGCTVRGDDTLIALEQTATNTQGRANVLPVVIRGYTIPAPPFGEGPECLERPEAKPIDR